MRYSLCLPLDEVVGEPIDFNRAADFLELSAFFSADGKTITSTVASEASMGAEEDHADLDAEMQHGGEELISGTVNTIKEREHVLGNSYPFQLTKNGGILRYTLLEHGLGEAAYILCLILSNLSPASAILANSQCHPDDDDERLLRKHFQYYATAALAAEIQGRAWSFGFPRPDGSGFVPKLKEIWRSLGDGIVEPQTGAPSQPKDDGVDIFSARLHRDQMPGFLFAIAQVATGQDMRDKSLLGQMGAFKSRWFKTQPVTAFIPYMIVPFAIQKNQFFDDVRKLGNVLHRLRVPLRVHEAEHLQSTGVEIEGYDQLANVLRWVEDYRERFVG